MHLFMREMGVIVAGGFMTHVVQAYTPLTEQAKRSFIGLILAATLATMAYVGGFL